MKKENPFFEYPEICKKCGGENCCKVCPGATFPEDFNNDKEKIVNAIKSGLYSIDWWEGDPGDRDKRTAFFIRPATKKGRGVIYDPSWGGECVFLEKTGCSLSAHERPKNCRDLEPKRNGQCFLHNESDKRHASLAWRKFYFLLNSFE